MSAAWHLDQAGYEVDLYEAGLRLGGHTDTHKIATAEGAVSVDTGFTVFNHQNYPNFHAWLEKLGVHSRTTGMSFAVRDERNGLEYGTSNVGAMTAHPRQLLRREYLGMWRDATRFYRTLEKGDIPDVSLKEFVTNEKYSEAFVHSHMVPMCATMWSQPPKDNLSLPLRHVSQFVRQHKMLRAGEGAQWGTIVGGSASYASAFSANFSGNVFTNCAVNAVHRGASDAYLDVRGETKRYDAVVLACHSDQALALLSNPSEAEEEILGALPFQQNDVYLHCDSSFMPADRRCWSSWNVLRTSDNRYIVTYWMNKLQGLRCDQQFFVTLNPPKEPQQIVWQGPYQHPQFSQAGWRAQQRWDEISNSTVHFAGAYWGKGFHEDGFVSGMRCADAIHSQVMAHDAVGTQNTN